MKIELLADHPEYIPLLAEWHHREWAYLRPGFSLADRVASLHERSGRSELPITFIASSEDELLGSAMLMHHEMDIRPQFTPWLAGVFVAPAHRHRGIGRSLAQHVIRAAKSLGYSTVYLYTPSAEAYWSRLGWSVVEHTRFRGADVTVMLHTQVT